MFQIKINDVRQGFCPTTNQPTSQITLLLGDQQREIVGGISGTISDDTLHLSKFYLCHNIRGRSYGSILLQNLILNAKELNIKRISMATHLNYIKNILINNNFSLKHNLKHHNTIYYFFEIFIYDFKVFPFKHDFKLITKPTEKEITSLENHLVVENKYLTHVPLLDYFYLTLLKKEEVVGYLNGYRTNSFIYLNEGHFEKTYEANIWQYLDKYAQSNNINNIYFNHNDEHAFTIPQGLRLQTTFI